MDATGAALDGIAIEWERIQVTLRSPLGGRDPAEIGRFRLVRGGGPNASPNASMPPTRAWIEGDTLALRFNVMQGPGQDPLVPGRWTLTRSGTGPAGRDQPVRIFRDVTVDAARDAAAFDVVRHELRRRYRVVPGIDPATRVFSLVVTLEAPGPAGSLRRRLRTTRIRAARAVREARAALFRRAFDVARRAVRRNGRRILFTSDSRAELAGNLALVHDRMVARGDRSLEIATALRPTIVQRRNLGESLRILWHLARADVIVIDDYQPIIYRIDVDRDVKIVQLWHASGPFKTVGYSRIGKEGGPTPWSRGHKNYTHAIVSSNHDVPYYAEAFGIPESRVIPTGIPRMDRYFDEDARARGRALALAAYPVTEGRRTILFAPTFRGDGPRDATYDPAWIDYAALHALATEQDALVIIRMHPFVRRSLEIPAAYADRLIDGAGAAIDVNDLLFIVDLLVTDYSSIIFEFSTLGRPMLFYAPDLEEYVASRDFYEPFETFVPGRIVRTFGELVEAIRDDACEVEKVARFAERHFAHLDGRSTDRVIDEVILAR